MKKALLISVWAIMALIMIVGNTSAQNITKEKVKETVKNYVKYPEFAIEEKLQGDVIVNFALNQDGCLKINEIYSRVPELQAYVKEKITVLKFPVEEKLVDEPILMRFSFQLL
jgi:hypothetical protein